MADNELDSMQVSFEADFSQLDSAAANVEDRFFSMSSAADDASSSISDGFDMAGKAAQSFAEMSQMAAENASAALGSDIPAATENADSAFSDMSSTLIEVLLEIRSAIQDVGYSVDGMSSAVTGSIEDLSVDFENLSVSATASADAIAEAGASSESAGSGGFMSLFNQIGFGIMNFQNYLNIAKQVATGLLGPAVSAETVTTALTTLDGSAQAAGQEMDKLNQFAAKTPFKTLDIDQAAEKLQGFGISANNVIPEITAIGDALGSVGNDTPAEMQSVVDIFGKINTEGKVTQMTMNELAVHGINGWQALADATGKTIPQVKQMVASGLLPAKDAINDLTKGIEMNPLYAGGMSKAAGTFTGLMSTLQSNFQQILASFGSPIIKALEPELSKIGAAFSSPAFQSFAGSVGQGIVNVFEGIGSAVSNVANLLGGLHIGDIFGTVSSSLSSLSKNTAVTGFLSALQTGFQSVSSIVGGQLSANFQTFSSTAQSLGKWWQSTMAPAIAQSMPGFENLGKIIATDVAPAFAKIWAVGQQVAMHLLPPLTKAFETVAPIIVKVGGFLANTLGQGLQFIMPYLVQAATAVGQFAEVIIDKATPIVENLWNTIQSGINVIMPIWNAVWPSMQQVLKGAWDMISGTIQIAWSIVSGIIKVGLDLLSGNWKGAWKDIQDTFSGVWSGLNTIVSGAWDTIKGLVSGGINAVIGIINDFINGLDKMHINVPGVGNVGFNIPDIPLVHFATGGFLGPGQVGVAGEEGPELIFGGTSGVNVMNHAQSMAAMSGSEVHVHNHNTIYLDSQEITDIVGPRIVQRWLNHGPIKTLRSA